ncbi:DUF6053 domain-containing protein [Lysobacter yananisis]|uniref:DUF6053 domain-containing protein n=1 Tax=Lysobacter yananisis TaxID=1003114 RepID=UPI003CE5B7D3
MGGPSGPMLFFQIPAMRDKSIGPERPPTSQRRQHSRLLPAGTPSVALKPR